MLKVQEYLRSGKSLEDLEREFAISANHHPILPLVILNYCQIDSPKIHPIVQECRSLVLEKDTWNIVSRAFSRFFNLGEALEVTSQFNWSDYFAYEKCDGSLCQLFYYGNEWRMITRNSWGDGLMTECNFSWSELFWKTLGKTQQEIDSKLSRDFSYAFEMMSPYNQVVVIHKEPKLSLLDAIHLKITGYLFGNEVSIHNDCVDVLANKIGVSRPKRFSLVGKTAEEVRAFVNTFSNQEEGLVLQDRNGLRLKLKGENYLCLHRLSGNNLFLYRDMYDLIVKGETSEILTYFPAAKPKCELLESILGDTKKKLVDFWPKIKDCVSQKEFALALLAEELPLGWVLFECRRHNLTVEQVFRLPSYADKIKKCILELVKGNCIMKLGKIKLTMKSPDGFMSSVDEYIDMNFDADGTEEEKDEKALELRLEVSKRLSKFIKWNEYVTVEVDLDSETATLLPA